MQVRAAGKAAAGDSVAAAGRITDQPDAPVAVQSNGNLGSTEHPDAPEASKTELSQKRKLASAGGETPAVADKPAKKPKKQKAERLHQAPAAAASSAEPGQLALCRDIPWQIIMH